MKVYWTGKQFNDATDKAEHPEPVTPKAGDTLVFSRSKPGMGKALAKFGLQGGRWTTPGHERLIIEKQAAHKPQARQRSKA